MAVDFSFGEGKDDGETAWWRTIIMKERTLKRKSFANCVLQNCCRTRFFKLV